MLRIRKFALLLTITLIVSACAQGTPNTPFPTTPESTAETISPIPLPTNAQLPAQTSTEPSLLRIINASTGTSALNLTAGFLTIASNLSSGQSTQPIEIDAGETVFKISISGSRSNDVPILEKTLTLNSGEPTLLLVTGSESQLDLLTLPETLQPVNSGESIITLINAASDTTAIKLQQNGQDLTTPIPFGQTITTGTLPTGEVVLVFYSGETKLLDYPTELEAQQAYTLILGGSTSQPNITLFSVNAPTRTSARAINASSEIGTVDVYLNETLLAGVVEFGRPTERQNIISGEYTLSIYPAGADRSTTAPFASKTVTIGTEANIALILLGAAENLEVVSYEENLKPTPPDEARIAVVNTLSQFASIHLEMGSGPLPGVPDMRYGDAPVILNLQGHSLNFYITGVDPNGVNNTVEVVENILFEPGRSYLYLVTGRLDNNPIILSESVGTDENLQADDNGTPQAVEVGSQIRFINALADGNPVDFVVGETPVATAIGYGQASALITVDQRTLTIGVRNSGGSSNLASIDNLIENNQQYTLIAYGTQDSAQMLLLPDAELISDSSTPRLRFVNLSASADIMLGLGFASVSATPAAEATANVGEEDDQRTTIPFDVQHILEDIAGGSTSNVISMPTGTFDLLILDTGLDMLATLISGAELETGMQYDVIAYQETSSPRVRAFLLVYSN
ncbi:MAG: DUF4397 domain-containing protein [Anaerolineae bacterium]|nr:DUF4397 domain-containing protein [Anaerolineae bacterium]